MSSPCAEVGECNEADAQRGRDEELRDIQRGGQTKVV